MNGAMEQSIRVSIVDESKKIVPCDPIRVSIVKESIRLPIVDEQVNVAIREERFDFSTPPVLATSGWPFGPNPTKMNGLQKGVATVVDTVTMPSYYRVAQWLFLIEDETNELAVTSTIKCILCGENVHYVEFAIMGDSGLIDYELDARVDGNKVNLIISSDYDGGDLTVRTSKIGIFQ